MIRQIYTPKKDLKEIVLNLLSIVNQLAWEQSYKELSGGFYYKETAEEINQLAEEMDKWGKPIKLSKKKKI